MKVKIEVAVFRMRDSGIIFTMTPMAKFLRDNNHYKSNESVEFVGFQFVEVDV